MAMVTIDMAWGLVLNSEVHIIIKSFIGNLDQAKVKSKKLFEDLQAMCSTNTKLGSTNKALQSKVGVLVSNEVVLKIKIDAATEDARQPEMRALEAQGAKGPRWSSEL
ncbi:hypothetical protein Adt_47323 [Abeliophyllum distichum]|uniref:Uncharacterized protein n=1 Tax=Abeliophyllum distichum TaxID=126358 RepID=A0ABD1NUS4_9LAMI